jgi:hypothetical protein
MVAGIAPHGGYAAGTTLLKRLARAFRRRRVLDARRHNTIDELAAAGKINSSYVSCLLSLTLLAPIIVEAILNGRQPEVMTLPALIAPFLVEWYCPIIIKVKKEFLGNIMVKL